MIEGSKYYKNMKALRKNQKQRTYINKDDNQRVTASKFAKNYKIRTFNTK